MGTSRNGNGSGSTDDRLEALKTLLDTALDIVVRAEETFARWMRVFARIPSDERELITAVVEREVDLRLLADVTGGTMIDLMRPNPHARLYIRVFDRERQLPYLSRDEIVRATMRASALMRHAYATPPMSEEWEVATLEAFGTLTAEERDAIRRVNQDILRLLQRFDQKPAASTR